MQQLLKVAENHLYRDLFVKYSKVGFDDLNAMCLKPLTHMCNLSRSQGIPRTVEDCKCHSFIYKGDDSMLFNNYRPVSVLYVVPKIVEKIMYNRVTTFIERSHILYCNKFRFREKSSTHVALLTFIDKVIQAI